jgi:hypothetical protein
MAAENGGERVLAHSLKSPARVRFGQTGHEPTSPNDRIRPQTGLLAGLRLIANFGVIGLPAGP